MNKLLTTLSAALLGCTALSLTATRASAAGFADVIVIADESGSMAGEHACLSGMIANLNTKLIAAGVGSGADANRFALVGYGNGLNANRNSGRLLTDFGSTAAFTTATSSLVTSGSAEDGYAGINFSLNTLIPRASAALNVILVTDEDRDNTDAALTFATIESRLTGLNALLNVIVNNPFSAPSRSGALGIDSNGNAYFANGSGGYTSQAGGVVGNGTGNTENDYVNLAFDIGSGGAAWDLNLLRSGGNNAASFTEAFVDIKVREILEQQPTVPSNGVPEPSTYGLIGVGFLLGLVALRRSRRQS